MNKDDSLALLGWAEAVMQMADLHAMTTRLFSARLDLIESVSHLRASLDQKRESAEAEALRDRLRQLEIEHGPLKARLHQDLLDAVARSESAHDQISASLARLRSQLEGSADDAS